MERFTENKIILVTRHTRLDELIMRFNTLKQAQFYLERQGADFSDYLKEDETYKQVLIKVENILSYLGRVQKLERSFLPNFIFAPQDTVVVLGQDGLVANTLKYLNGQRVVGVNPDPQRWEGVLLPFQVDDLKKVVLDVFARHCTVKEITMAKVTLNNGQILHGVNDLFIGPRSHTSARYLIQIGHQREQHLSSGIIVSTGLGSTGWFKSLMTGALSISQAWNNLHPPQNAPTHPKIGDSELEIGQFLRNDVVPKHSPSSQKSKQFHPKTPQIGSYQFPWDADYLYFTVREPFLSATSSSHLVFGKIAPHQPMLLVSQMPENGVIFSDGIESDFLKFDAGTEASIGVAEKRGQLVV